MSKDLDLDDVAATSFAAKKELEELRDSVGLLINPIYLLWRIWHGDNDQMKSFHFMEWNNLRLNEYCRECGINRPLYSDSHKSQYQLWLMQWVRRHILMGDLN